MFFVKEFVVFFWFVVLFGIFIVVCVINSYFLDDFCCFGLFFSLVLVKLFFLVFWVVKIDGDVFFGGFVLVYVKGNGLIICGELNE